MMVNGNRILGGHDLARVYDISDPTNITLEGTGPSVAYKGRYGTFKDGHFSMVLLPRLCIFTHSAC